VLLFDVIGSPLLSHVQPFTEYSDSDKALVISQRAPPILIVGTAVGDLEGDEVIMRLGLIVDVLVGSIER